MVKTHLGLEKKLGLEKGTHTPHPEQCRAGAGSHPQHGQDLAVPRGLHGWARRDTLLHPIPLDPLPLISRLHIPSLRPAPSSSGEALNANEPLSAARDVADDGLVVARQWQAGAWRGCGTGNGPGLSHCVGQMSLALRVRTLL